MEINRIIDRLFNTSAPVLAMAANRAWKNWPEQVNELGKLPALAPFRGVLEGLVRGGVRNPEPLNTFLKTQNSEIDLPAFRDASSAIADIVDRLPQGALIASVTVLKGWAVKMGDLLYAQRNGVPHGYWMLLPEVCARAALKTGAVEEARLLIEECIEVLTAAKYFMVPPLSDALTRYRSLEALVSRRLTMALWNLAGELRESCKGEPNFRAETGAMLWSLGLVPESRLLRHDSPRSDLPPPRLCRQAVRLSMEAIPVDPLIQYVWLELKDRPPFNVRDHSVFFGKVNNRYVQLLEDELFPEPPSQLYARTLIAHFAGSLTEDLASQYFETYGYLHGMFPGVDWSIYLRMSVLAWQVGRQFGWLKEEATASEYFLRLSDIAANLNKTSVLHPEWPEFYTRISGAVFQYIEECLGTRNPSSALAALERYRASSLFYTLKVNPPLLAPGDGEAIAPMLAAENTLIQHLRGAYFLILGSVLPRHYSRYAAEIETFQAAKEKPETYALNPATGLREFKEIEAEMASLYEKMKDAAPNYVARRTHPEVTLPELAAAIRPSR